MDAGGDGVGRGGRDDAILSERLPSYTTGPRRERNSAAHPGEGRITDGEGAFPLRSNGAWWPLDTVCAPFDNTNIPHASPRAPRVGAPWAERGRSRAPGRDATLPCFPGAGERQACSDGIGDRCCLMGVRPLLKKLRVGSATLEPPRAAASRAAHQVVPRTLRAATGRAPGIRLSRAEAAGGRLAVRRGERQAALRAPRERRGTSGSAGQDPPCVATSGARGRGSVAHLARVLAGGHHTGGRRSARPERAAA